MVRWQRKEAAEYYTSIFKDGKIINTILSNNRS